MSEERKMIRDRGNEWRVILEVWVMSIFRVNFFFPNTKPNKT